VDVPSSLKNLIDRSFIQRVCTSKNAKEKIITEDYKNMKIRITGVHNEE
jgi:hypothetical protein